MNELKTIKNCEIGQGTKIYDFVNLYGCRIGRNCMIAPFVEIQEGVKIGNNCRISSHTFICSGVEIGNNVFVGHGVMFINDKDPPRDKSKWEKIYVKDNVSIGSNSTIMPVIIEENALVGAGSVVTRDVRKGSVVIGNPARQFGIDYELEKSKFLQGGKK